MDWPRTPGNCARLACILEATARKAGNVHPSQSFDDLNHLDFLASAAAIVPTVDAGLPLGMTILQAVEATRKVVTTNTNLGILLLLAPLAAATRHESLRAGLETVLASTTVPDSVNVYRAIRAANPGGLGSAKEEDVRNEPTRPLRDVMVLAASRDLIARQYANGFDDLWSTGVPALERAWQEYANLEAAIVKCHLVLMAAGSDTLILRKAGPDVAERSRALAASILEIGWPESTESRLAFGQFDAWLRAEGNRRNPGATADLVTACLFVALWQNTIPWRDHFTPFAGVGPCLSAIEFV